MGKIIKILIGLTVLVLVVITVAISIIDVNQYKDDIIQLVKENTGRSFEVGGRFEMALSLIPTVVVEDVRFGNAAWGSKPDMLHVDRFEVEVALLPLLSKNIHITRLILISPDILIETNKEGKGNWVIGEPSKAEKEAEKAVMGFNINEIDIQNANLTYKDGVTGETTHLTIEEFKVDTDGFSDPMDIVLKAVYKEIPVNFDGRLGSLASLNENENFPVKFKASVGDIKLKMDGQVGKPKDIKDLDITLTLEAESLATITKLTGKKLPKGGPLKINGHFLEDDDIYTIEGLKAEFGVIKAAIDGTIKDPQQAKGFDLDISLDADSLVSIGKLAEKELPAVGPVKITSHVSEAEGLYTIKGLKASLGKIKIGADGTFGDPTKVKGFDLAINLNLENLADLNKLSGGNLPSIGPVTLSTQVKDKKGAYQLSKLKAKVGNTDIAGDATINLSGKRPALAATLNSNLIDLVPFTGDKKKEQKKVKKEKVFSSDPLPFESLKAADANLNINAKQIKTADLTLDKVKLVLKLNNGKLKISPFNTNLAGGTLTMQMNLDASSGKSGILDTKIDIKNLQPSKLPDFKDKFTKGKTDVNINLKGKGKSVAAIMAGSNGKLLVKMGPGTFKSSSTDTAKSDVFSSLKNTIYSDKSGSSGVTEINCAVINLKIKDGIATSDKGIAINTTKMSIIGSGVIDLKTEKLDIGIDPQAREGMGISAGQLAELVRVGGTLANPKIVPDTKAAFKAAVSAGTGVFSGGLSILGLGSDDPKTSDDDPCAIALGIKPKKKATTTTAEKSATQEEDKSVTTKAVDTVKDAGTAIKDTFKGLFGN